MDSDNSSKKRLSKLKAISRSEQEEVFIRNEDYIGLKDLRIEKIRQLKERSEVQEKALREYQAEEEYLTQEPHEAMREAYKAIDRGVDILLKIIRSKSLLQENKIADSDEGYSHDLAFDCLSSRLDFLNRQLIRVAGEGVPRSCQSLWFQSKVLTEATMRLALSNPKAFRGVAETSLTMPSLRARNHKYTADAEAIAQAIGLAEKHPVPTISDNRSRIGGLTHHFVAKRIEEIDYYRREYLTAVEQLKMFQRFSVTSSEYSEVTLAEFIESRFPPERASFVVTCGELPEWPRGSDRWWKDALVPLVRKEFELAWSDPLRNPGLIEELKRGGERNTKRDSLRYLEKLSRNKFQQFLKNCP